MTDDISGANYWAIDYLRLPPERIEEGRRATALNFCTSADAGLSKDWEAVFERVLAKLRGDSVNNVSPLSKNKPVLGIVPRDDTTG